MNPLAPRVLIVDDQPANVHLLAEALGSEYELLVATNAVKALELAGGVDLVLLDVLMPGMDGLEVCRRLRNDSRTRRIPVIFVTALEQTEDETLGFEAGAVDYIVKPINPAIVRARVRTHLELKAARDLLERLATHDVLTGIANRRRFDEAIGEEWRRAARSGRVLTVALADIDHFKTFNDRYGHGGGDACLKAVAQALDALCRRPGELAARHGGEEFAIMLPDVDAVDARRFVARALSAVASLEVEGLAVRSESRPRTKARDFSPDQGAEPQEYREYFKVGQRRAGGKDPLSARRDFHHGLLGPKGLVNISMGALTLVPLTTNAPSDGLQVADEALYEAKRTGRRRGVLRQFGSAESIEVVQSNEDNTL